MILITGANGTIGSELVFRLSVSGTKVRAMVRNPEKATLIAFPNVEIVQGEFEKPSTLELALRGVDQTILISPPRSNQTELESNFLRTAQRLGSGHIIRISLMGADVDSPVSLARWHRRSELQLESSGIPFTILRSNFLMQNLIRYMASQIKSENKFYLPMQEARVSLIDGCDIAEAAAALLTRNTLQNQTYTLTGPEALSFYEVAEKLSRATGKNISYVNISPEEFKASLHKTRESEWVVTGLVEMAALAIRGKLAPVTGTVTELIGHIPSSFDQFAKKHAREFGHPSSEGFFDTFYRGVPPWDIGRAQQVFMRLAEEGEIKGTVLDVGCGTGENLLYLAERGHEVCGIDFSLSAIEKAKSKALHRGLAATFMMCDAMELPCLGRTFDTVIDCGLFHVFTDEERPSYVKSLGTVLKPGGNYFMLCFSEHEPGTWGPRRVTEAEIRSLFQEEWRINYIKEARFENHFNAEGAQAWLTSITLLEPKGK